MAEPRHCTDTPKEDTPAGSHAYERRNVERRASVGGSAEQSLTLRASSKGGGCLSPRHRKGAAAKTVCVWGVCVVIKGKVSQVSRRVGEFDYVHRFDLRAPAWRMCVACACACILRCVGASGNPNPSRPRRKRVYPRREAFQELSDCTTSVERARSARTETPRRGGAARPAQPPRRALPLRRSCCCACCSHQRSRRPSFAVRQTRHGFGHEQQPV